MLIYIRLWSLRIKGTGDGGSERLQLGFEIEHYLRRVRCRKVTCLMSAEVLGLRLPRFSACTPIDSDRVLRIGLAHLDSGCLYLSWRAIRDKVEASLLDSPAVSYWNVHRSHVRRSYPRHVNVGHVHVHHSHVDHSYPRHVHVGHVHVGYSHIGHSHIGYLYETQVLLEK